MIAIHDTMTFMDDTGLSMAAPDIPGSVWDNRKITSVHATLEARCQLTSSVGNSASASGGINIAPQTLAQCQKETLAF